VDDAPPSLDGIRLTHLHVGDDSLVVLSSEDRSRKLNATATALTEAERQVLALLLEGHSNAEIATTRSTSERTVANQVAAIFRKLHVSSRCELVTLVTGHERSA